MKDKNEFKGWDWEELIPLLGMEEEYARSEKAEYGDILQAEKKLLDAMGNKICGYNREHPEDADRLIGELRTFLRKVADQSGYYKPFFEGILNLEEKDVFLQMFAMFIGGMWT